jgi:hypothetical protein
MNSPVESGRRFPRESRRWLWTFRRRRRSCPFRRTATSAEDHGQVADERVLGQRSGRGPSARAQLRGAVRHLCGVACVLAVAIHFSVLYRQYARHVADPAALPPQQPPVVPVIRRPHREVEFRKSSKSTRRREAVSNSRVSASRRAIAPEHQHAKIVHEHHQHVACIFDFRPFAIWRTRPIRTQLSREMHAYVDRI